MSNVTIDVAGIDDLLCRLAVFGGQLSPAKKAVAVRALKRLKPVIEMSGSQELSSDGFVKLFSGQSARHLREEFNAIVAAADLPPVPALLASRMLDRTVKFEDAIEAIELHIKDPRQRTQHRNASLRLCSVLQVPPAGVNADLRSLCRVFRSLKPGDFDTSAGGFSTIKSRVLRVARHVDLSGTSYDRRAHMAGPWRQIADGLDDAGLKRLRLNLWPLIGFCHARGIEPWEVDDSVIAKLIVDLEDRAVNKPFERARKAVYAWQEAQKKIAGFPTNTLSRIYKSKSGISLRFDDLPRAFRKSWEEFAALAEHQQQFDPAAVFDDIDALLAQRPVAAASISAASLPNLRTALSYAAHAHPAPGKLTQIDDVLNPECVRGALKLAHERQKAAAQAQQKPAPAARNSHLKNIAQNILRVARHRGIEPRVLDEIQHIGWQVDPDVEKIKRQPDGTYRPVRLEPTMGPRHRERLREFAKPGKLRAFLAAPRTLMSIAEDKSRPLALRRCAALNAAAHAILQSAPIRRRNLTQIRLSGPERNLQMFDREERAMLYLDATETKGKSSFTIEISGDSYRILKKYVEEFRSRFLDAVAAAPSNPYLFPAHGLKHRDPSLMNKNFGDHNLRLGFTMNLHLARHLTAKVALDKGLDIATVSQLLGHKSIKTTERYYAECVEIFAQREYHRALLGSHFESSVAGLR